MKEGNGIIIGFFVLLAILSIGGMTFISDSGSNQKADNQNKIFSTANVTSTTTREVIISAPSEQTPEIPPISNAEAEKGIQKLYKELDGLKEDLRVAILHEPISPFYGEITLKKGNARDTNPEREYLILETNRNNSNNINISNWYLESYVTEKRASIPQGTRLLKSLQSTKDSDIYLAPNEKVYLLTTETPLRVSFHENKCTGYIKQTEYVYPSLSRKCPRPTDEMLNFASIKLDDDTCYDFVESIKTCEYVDDTKIDNANIGNRCKRFAEEYLNYNGCVKAHQNDPFFDDVGYWRIYLNRKDELWRYEREIIRLMDENDKVISVLEY